MFPPKNPLTGGAGAAGPKSLRDIRLGMRQLGSGDGSGGTPAVCPSCGEKLTLSSAKPEAPGGPADTGDGGDEGEDTGL